MTTTITLRHGDITTASTDVIVNAANNEFWMGAGVAGAIKAAGGDVVEKEAMAKGPVTPGEAVATTAGALRFNYVIHGAVMGQSLTTTAELIRKTTLSSLQLAEQLKQQSVALPAFGTGIGGFPIAAAARNIYLGIEAFLPTAVSVSTIEIWLYTAELFREFDRVLLKRRPTASKLDRPDSNLAK